MRAKFDLKEAAKFLAQCKPSETIVFYHGGCADGICAAAILSKFFRAYFGERPRKIYFSSPGTLGKIRGTAPYMIFIDLAADQEKSLMAELSKHYKILVLDHHQLSNNLNELGILHVNPQFYGIAGISYPGAKLVYDACSILADMSDSDWLAAIGIIHDGAGEFWKEFLNKIFKKYKELGKINYGFNSKLGELVSILTAGQELKKGNEIALKICLEAERPSDILEARLPEVGLLMDAKKLRDEELNYYLSNWEKLADFDKNLQLVIYDIDLKHKISSALATALSQRYPNLTFIVINKESPSVLKLNFRQTKAKIDCAWLAKVSTVKFGGSGGGHPQAAGGRIHPKYKQQFKNEIRELLKQKRK